MKEEQGSTDGPPVAVIISTYNEPGHLERCLQAIGLQDFEDFEILIADDGSGEETRTVIERFQSDFGDRLKHIWHEDRGFRKSLVVNKAITSTSAEYLVFLDGDCVVPPWFVAEHVERAEYGYYLNGAMIRLDQELSAKITPQVIETGKVFDAAWLKEAVGKWDHRFLKLSLGYRLRQWLNQRTPMKLCFLGGNASCFRTDALAVNGFNNGFSHGLADADFGNRLINYGLQPATARWTVVVLHLEHERSNQTLDEHEDNRQNMTSIEAGGEFFATDGIGEIDLHTEEVASG